MSNVSIPVPQNSLGVSDLRVDQVTASNYVIPTIDCIISSAPVVLADYVGPLPVPRLAWLPFAFPPDTDKPFAAEHLPAGYRFTNKSYVVPLLSNGPVPDQFNGTVCFGAQGPSNPGLARGSVWFWLPLVPDTEDPGKNLALIGTIWKLQCFNLEVIPIGDPSGEVRPA